MQLIFCYESILLSNFFLIQKNIKFVLKYIYDNLIIYYEFNNFISDFSLNLKYQMEKVKFNNFHTFEFQPLNNLTTIISYSADLFIIRVNL